MVGRVSRPKSSPFDQGLDTDVVVRLLDGTWEEADRRKYERCASGRDRLMPQVPF